MDAKGVAVAAKKPEGYVSVMVPPVAIAPSAEVVKENVAAAAVLLATRSAGDIEKETKENVAAVKKRYGSGFKTEL